MLIYGVTIMKMTLYRQAAKVRDGGQIVYKGEDAPPFIGENCFIVADGMGGAAAIRHTKFNTDIFCEDKIFDVMFKDALPDADEETVNYIKKAFFELYAVKDCYFSNALNMKKSGYFGSRTCVASFIYFAKKMFAAGVGNDLEKLHAASDECKAEMMEKIGRYFTENIKNSMVKISESANLIYETAFSGFALMGTTMCGTLFFEREDEVDAIYLVAGDSRPFQWDSAGLKLVVEDQKRADGGMTNYIKANGDFSISASFRTFKKPCVLFNASDGVYESAQFSVSELGLEKLLIETILDSNDMTELKAKLEEIYLKYGTHDDSSTMALTTFGYESYDDLKKAASERLKKINEDYIDKMPDFLENSYIDTVERAKKTAMIRNNAIAVELYKRPVVAEYCKNKVTGEDCSEKIAALKTELEAKKQEKEETLLKIRNFLCENVGVTESEDSDEEKSGAVLNNTEKYCMYRNIRHISEEESAVLVEQLLNNDIAPDKIGLRKSLANELKSLVDAHMSAKSSLAETEKNLEGEISSAQEKYWLSVSNESDDITALSLKEGLISEEDAVAINEKYPATEVVDEETENKAALQGRLLEKYDSVFYSLIKENN